MLACVLKITIFSQNIHITHELHLLSKYNNQTVCVSFLIGVLSLLFSVHISYICEVIWLLYNQHISMSVY